jgi:predicted MPP superfamily phosphohydrolase
VRVVVFLLLSAGAHFVLARWLLAVSGWARARRRKVLFIAGVLSVMAAGLRLTAYAIEAEIVRTLMAFAMVELAVVVIGMIFTGLAMLVTRAAARLLLPPPAQKQATTIGRREAVERVAGAVAFGGTGLALGWGFVRGRHAFAVEEVVVRVAGWPRVLDGYVIAQVSDVHVGTFVGDRELDEGFELVTKLRPDLVVATGDLVDFDSGAVGPLALRLLRAGARDGAYAILGNHDHYAGAAEVASRLRAAGVGVLSNEAVRLRAGDGGGFALLGVDDLQGRTGRSPGFSGPDLRTALRGLPPSLPRILLAHQPNYFDESSGRIALQLSGHTHGGQINPGFRPVDAFMKYVAGRYDAGDSTLYVNRGFGVSGPPSRVGAPPEVTKIVIVSA